MSARLVALKDICAYGYFRKYFEETPLNMAVDIDVASVCVQYLEHGLKWLFSIKEMDEKILLHSYEGSSANSKCLKLLNNKHELEWESMTASDRRLMTDILSSSEHNQFISEIECSSSSFGVEGAEWISSVISSPLHSLQYIHLPNCNLDIDAVKIIVESLEKTESIRFPLFLDLSDNKQIDDKCLELIVAILPKLYYLKLNGCNLTDRALDILNKFQSEKAVNLDHDIVLHLCPYKLREGVHARLKGLKRAPEFNGKLVEIQKYDARNGRWTLKLLDTKEENDYLEGDEWISSYLDPITNEDKMLDLSKWNGHVLSERDALLVIPRDVISNEVCPWTGIWKGEYGPHGTEYQYIREAVNKNGDSYLVARKITGDQNVPEGKITWMLFQIPSVSKDKNDSTEIKGCLQIREDTTDPNAFEWDDNLTLVNTKDNQITLRWRYWDMVYDQITFNEKSPVPIEKEKPVISSTLGGAQEIWQE